MQQDKVWVDGLRVYKPDEKAPDFVKANIVINKAEMLAWLATQPDDKIKVQMKEARSGNYYTEVDTYQRKENPAEQLSEQLPVDDNFDDDIPF